MFYYCKNIKVPVVLRYVLAACVRGFKSNFSVAYTLLTL